MKNNTAGAFRLKKIIAIFLIAVMCVSGLALFAGCDDRTPDGKKIVNVHIPTQTPSLAMLKMMLDDVQVDAENYKTNYNLENGSDAIRAAMINPATKADIVIAPTHIIANLFNQAQNPVRYQIVAATSFGAFHIISTDPDVKTFADLEGKTVYCQGAAGGSNEYVLRYLLENFADEPMNVTLDFNPAVPALLKQGTATIGLIPEPALTNAKKLLGATPFETIDLQDVWKTVTGHDNYPLACLAFRKDFLDSNKAFCDAFIAKVEDSVDWITKDATPTEIATALTTLKTNSEERLDTGVAPEFFNEQDPGSISRLNIGFTPANKVSVTYYLTVMGIFDNMFYNP